MLTSIVMNSESLTLIEINECLKYKFVIERKCISYQVSKLLHKMHSQYIIYLLILRPYFDHYRYPTGIDFLQDDSIYIVWGNDSRYWHIPK
jgi:hypothetical protein